MIYAPRDEQFSKAIGRLNATPDFQMFLEWLESQYRDNHRTMDRETDETVLRWRQGVSQTLDVIFTTCESARPTHPMGL